MSNQKTKALAAANKSSSAVSIHCTDGETHFVGIGPIKVIICNEDESWFAQGVDIDYAANGGTLDQVKLNFEKGLAGTVDLHIKLYGDLKKFLKHAPQEVWDELYAVGTYYHYHYARFHDDLSKTLGLTKYDGLNFVVKDETKKVADEAVTV